MTNVNTAPIDANNLDEITVDEITEAVKKVDLVRKENSLPRKALRFARRHQTTLLVATGVSVALAFVATRIEKDDLHDVIDALPESE